ncbi:MAG: GFA family protein [Methanomicrobiales archaeon]|nr:GFA family protein [Methanomicrobiales archaeon]
MGALLGSCLCGKVKYEINGKLEIFKFCFCPRCQKVSGSAQAANILVDYSQFRWIDGENNVVRYDLPEAKRFAHGFCKTCGSPVPYELRDKTGIVIPAGSLDSDPGIKPQGIIYWDHRPQWYVEPDGLQKQ